MAERAERRRPKRRAEVEDFLFGPNFQGAFELVTQFDLRFETIAHPNTPQKQSSSSGENVCALCEDGGELVLCDSCPKAWHLACAGLSSVPSGLPPLPTFLVTLHLKQSCLPFGFALQTYILSEFTLSCLASLPSVLLSPCTRRLVCRQLGVSGPPL